MFLKANKTQSTVVCVSFPVYQSTRQPDVLCSDQSYVLRNDNKSVPHLPAFTKAARWLRPVSSDNALPWLFRKLKPIVITAHLLTYCVSYMYIKILERGLNWNILCHPSFGYAAIYWRNWLCKKI